MDKPYYKCLFIKKNTYTKKKSNTVISKCGPFTNFMSFRQTMLLVSHLCKKWRKKNDKKRLLGVNSTPWSKKTEHHSEATSHW